MYRFRTKKFAMMAPTELDRELITDLAAENTNFLLVLFYWFETARPKSLNFRVWPP
jgi:hypothetical protein